MTIPTLEDELSLLLKNARDAGAKINSLSLTVEFRDSEDKAVRVRHEMSNTVLFAPSWPIRQILVAAWAEALNMHVPDFTTYYGATVRVIAAGEEYLVQSKNGSVWKTHKAIPQANTFAATDARSAAQALARATLGGN